MTQQTDRLLTRDDVEERTGLGRSTIYAWISEDRFPAPFKLGAKAVRWSEREVSEWIARQPRTKATNG